MEPHSDRTGMMVHEKIWPFVTGTSQQVFVAMYGVYAFALFYRYRRIILSGPWPLMMLAMIGLGGSVVIDAVLPNSDATVFVEDSLKLFGIVYWSIFLGLFSHRALCHALGRV